MSVDESIRVAINEALREALERELPMILAAAAEVMVAQPLDGPLDAKALKARGYSQAEAYGLLRAHGFRVPAGRRIRMAPEILNAIEKGELAREL